MEFNEIERQLMDSPAGRIALTDLRRAQKIMTEAEGKLDKTGLLYRTPNGTIEPSPLLRIVDDQAKRILEIMHEFKLTPASRAKAIA